ncbi:MAG: hypothetical protein WEB06_20660 [Actinomycetota bacterium]
MSNRDAEAPAGDQHPGDFPDRTLQVFDVLKRHEGDNQVHAVARHRQPTHIPYSDKLSTGLVGKSRQGRRRVDSNNAVTAFGEESPNSTLTTGEIESHAARSGK